MSAPATTDFEALVALVEGLKQTSWSSWQATASFANQLKAADDLIARRRIEARAPQLLETVELLADRLEWHLDHYPAGHDDTDEEFLDAARRLLVEVKGGTP